ncbi:LysE family translocator [Candidatus Woesearchaeota archaeon]|nr:LysE family translocator [Candidatus Woesearchaeota archaeon]
MLGIIRYFILGISLAAPIGPVTVALIKRSLKQGFKQAALFSLGVALADTTFLIIIYLGLYRLMDNPLVKTITWFFGSVILLCMGIYGIYEFFRKIDLDETSLPSKRSSLALGYIIAISNPISIVWWVGVFGSVIALSITDLTKLMVILNGFIIILGALFWYIKLSTWLHWGRRFVNEKSMRYVSLVAGLFLAGFGFYFGYNAVLSLV